MTKGQECNIIYIAPTGDSTGVSGTKSSPANLAYGLSLVDSMNLQLRMASGSYSLSSTLNMLNDVTIEGGYNDSSWAKSNADATVIFRDSLNISTSPNRLIAISCNGISNFRLQDLTITVANAVGDGVTTYGVYLDSCTDYSITRCNIIAGNGSDGYPGVQGIDGINGTYGLDGETGDGGGPCCTLGGLGGDSTYIGSYAGGNGGDGGARGTGTSACSGPGNEAPDGLQGLDGLGSGGGIGGAGGVGVCGNICASMGCDAGPMNAGIDGVLGATGASGNTGNSGTPGFGNYFINGNGLVGQDGEHGSGGGGGGGGGSQGCLWSVFGDENGAGAGGGGGGEGGQGGYGGTGGNGGGGSFGIYINTTGANSVIKECTIVVGTPGTGATGAIGGVGAFGGNGGIGTSSDCDLGDPGDGGSGGDGGMGGDGGNGADGLAVNIYQDTSGIPIDTSAISTAEQPRISVNNTGCLNSVVVFSTDTTGTITWNFGDGSSPSGCIGNGCSTSYVTEGKKTITMTVDTAIYTYSDFIEIDTNNSATNPTIIALSTGSFCPGDTGSFVSVVTSLNYIWTIQKGGFSDTVEGPGFQVLTYTFDSVGTYTVALATEDACCGLASFSDSVSVTVDPVMAPTITIQSSDSMNTACDGDSLSFLANLTNGESSEYQWFVNGLPVGTDTFAYATAALIDTDLVKCVVINGSGCAAGLIDTSNTISVNVVPQPMVNFQGNPLVVNDLTDTIFFTNSSTNSDIWEWYFGDSLSLNNISNQENPSHYYTSNGLYDVKLIATNSFGCSDTMIIPNYILVDIDTNSTGVKENKDNPNFGFAVFPNPASDHINLIFNLADNENVELKLLNIEGKEILGTTINSALVSKGQYRLDLKSNEISEGVYVIDLIYKDKHYYNKVVINPRH